MNIADVPLALLAGGLAARLRPITETIPKSSVEVAGTDAYLRGRVKQSCGGGREPLESPDRKPPLRAAVFLDRDGVLNETLVRDGVPHPPAHLGEFKLLAGVPAALERLAGAGFALVVVTNQPDVARGTQTRERVEELNERVRAMLPVLDVLTCFHDDADECDCRKPHPGLLLEAARRWHLDLGRSFMVGDRWSDIVAGQAAGCRTVLIEMPYSGRGRCSPDWCVANLTEAADWIVGCSCANTCAAPSAREEGDDHE